MAKLKSIFFVTVTSKTKIISGLRRTRFGKSELFQLFVGASINYGKSISETDYLLHYNRMSECSRKGKVSLKEDIDSAES